MNDSVRPGAGGVGGDAPGRLFEFNGGARRCGIAVLAFLLAGSAAAEDFTHYAADPARSGWAEHAPSRLSSVLWLAAEYPAGTPIRFEGPSSPVVYKGRVYANARHYSGTVHVANKLMAFDAGTGAVAFATIVDKAVLDSWSSPAVDVTNNTVLLGSGSKLYAIDATSGDIVWSCPLVKPVVNASPLVAEGVSPGRAFMTDFDGTGESASLYCINTSPFSSPGNPYQPGQIVWQEPIGSSSGNSPAHADGVVYVSSVSRVGAGCEEQGAVSAFDANAPAASRRLWTSCLPDGSFGGVAYHAGAVYAATYDFWGTGDVATLAKLRCSDGEILWTTPCERTASIPVVDNDRIYLSAGLNDFGSAPRLQAFRDMGESVVKLWDTYQDTGGSLVLGGWTHQPQYCDHRLAIGAIPLTGGSMAPYTALYLLDLERMPTDPQFVLDQRSGMGSSPASCGGRMYSIGAAGLYALARKGDYCGQDGMVNGLDIPCFLRAMLSATPTAQDVALGDFDLNGVLTIADTPGFVSALLGC